jgi:hypothetical protein
MTQRLGRRGRGSYEGVIERAKVDDDKELLDSSGRTILSILA